MHILKRLLTLILTAITTFTPTQVEAALPAFIDLPATSPSRTRKPSEKYLVPVPGDFSTKMEKEKELHEAFRQHIVREKRLYYNITKYVDGPKKGDSHIDELISETRGSLLRQGTVVLNAETYYLCADDGTLYHKPTTAIMAKDTYKLTIPKGALLLKTSKYGLAIALPGGLYRAIEAINGFLLSEENQDHIHWEELCQVQFKMLLLCGNFISNGLFTENECLKLAGVNFLSPGPLKVDELANCVYDFNCSDDMSAINALDYLVDVLALLKAYTNHFIKNQEKTTKIEAIDEMLHLVQQTRQNMDRSSLDAFRADIYTPTETPKSSSSKTGSPKKAVALTPKQTNSAPIIRRTISVNRPPLASSTDHKTALPPTINLPLKSLSTLTAAALPTLSAAASILTTPPIVTTPAPPTTLE